VTWGGEGVDLVQRGLVQLQPQHRPTRTELVPAWVDTLLQEVQGTLRVGQDPDRLGPAYIQVVVVAQGLERFGGLGQGLVERVGIGGVQGHVDVGGGRGVPGPQLHLAVRECLLFVVDGAVGVVVEPRLVDKHPDPGTGQPGRVAGEKPVGRAGGLHRQIASRQSPAASTGRSRVARATCRPR